MYNILLNIQVYVLLCIGISYAFVNVVKKIMLFILHCYWVGAPNEQKTEIGVWLTSKPFFHKPGGLSGAWEEGAFTIQVAVRVLEVHPTKQKSFFWESGRAFVAKFTGQLHVISRTPVSPASQMLPWSSRMLHTLLGLHLQEAQKPIITHTKTELRGGAQSRCFSQGNQWEKMKKSPLLVLLLPLFCPLINIFPDFLPACSPTRNGICTF